MFHTAQHAARHTARHAAPGLIHRTWSTCKAAPAAALHATVDAARAVGQFTAELLTFAVVGCYVTYVVIPRELGRSAVRSYRAWRAERTRQAKKLGGSVDQFDTLAATGVIDPMRWTVDGEVRYTGEVADFDAAVDRVVSLAEELLADGAATEPVYAALLADQLATVTPIRRSA